MLLRRGHQPLAGANEWAFYLIKLGVNWPFSIIFGPDWTFNNKCGMCARAGTHTHREGFSGPRQEEIGLYRKALNLSAGVPPNGVTKLGEGRSPVSLDKQRPCPGPVC